MHAVQCVASIESGRARRHVCTLSLKSYDICLEPSRAVSGVLEVTGYNDSADSAACYGGNCHVQRSTLHDAIECND